jgi:hypothetical protein
MMRPIEAVGLSRIQPWRTQNQKKPTTRSNFFFLDSAPSPLVERHSVRLRGLKSRRKTDALLVAECDHLLF